MRVKCEALDDRGNWRPAAIVQLTPKNFNYPNGGAYIQWLDIDPSNRLQSQGGWMPPQCLRAYGDTSEVPMTKY